MKHYIYNLWHTTMVAALLVMTTGIAASSDDKPSIVADSPVVLATTKPLHSIAAFVTDGVSDARLLLDGSVSPHVLQLKPSHVRAVSEADVVIWAGSGVERFIPSMLDKFAPDAADIELAALPGVVTFPARKARRDLGSNHGSEHDHEHGDEGDIDSHVWLHPANAELLALALADQLSVIDKDNAKTYRSNADALVAELNHTVKDIEQILQNSRDTQYLIYHDSLQYFEKAFGLGEAIIVTAKPQVQAGAKRIRMLQDEVVDGKVNCILVEQQFRAPALEVLADDLNLRMVKIDPLASGFTSGPTLYTDWLKRTAESIAECTQ